MNNLNKLFLSLLFLLSHFVGATQMVISEGGTYTGLNLTNTDPTKAVLIIATSDTVKILNSTLTTRGNGIEVDGRAGKNFKIHVENTVIQCLNPNVPGQQHGRAFDSNNMTDGDYFVFRHNHLIETSGIRIRDVMNKARPIWVDIRYNKVDVIQGRWSNGNGGYRKQQLVASDSRQFVVFRRVWGAGPGFDGRGLIAWNEIVNTGRDAKGYPDGWPKGMQEDIINFNAGGFQAANNIMVYGGPFDPYTDKHSGVGIISDPAGEYCERLLIGPGNYVIGVLNAGISIHNANQNGDVWVRGNVVINDGADPSGKNLLYNSVALSHQFNARSNTGFEGNIAMGINTRPTGNTRDRKDYNFSKDPESIPLNTYPMPGQDFGWETERRYILEYYLKASAAGITFGPTDGETVPDPTPDPDPGPDPTPDPDPTPEPDPTPQPEGFFYLVQPGTPGKVVRPIADGDTVYLSEYANFTIEAKATKTATFTLNGAFVSTDGAPPYLLCGNRGWQNYNNVSGCEWTPGAKLLEVNGNKLSFYVAKERAPAPPPAAKKYEIRIWVDGEPRFVDIPPEILDLILKE